MNQRVVAAKAWADAESALRSKYQDMGLYVRKQVYDRPDGVTMVVGGWAFLDGEPAMIPTDLDLLVVSADGAGGELETMGRDPAAVLGVLSAYATKESAPIEHWAVRVPEAQKAGLLAQIRALPEHTPGAAPKPSAGAFGAPMGAPAAGGFGAPVASPYGAPVAQPAHVSKSGSNTGLIVGGIIGGAVLLAVCGVCGIGGIMFFAARRASEDAYRYEPPPIEPYDYEPTPTPAPEPVAARPAAGDHYDVPLPARAPTRGPASAPVTIQVFSDFQCPFCARVNPTMEQVVETYPSDVRIVWRHYPLPFHQNAMPAAEASVEVYEQAGDAAFWAYHDLLFENQRSLTTDTLISLSGRVQGVDSSRVGAALRDHRHRARVQSDMDAVRDAGMRIGTPSFLINGELVSGAQPFSRFQTAIEAARAGG
ncbi:MAG: thioredoxin domain-containing protein [Sandaracinaceae bacterium]|nr:thioredoxin domain-containing protein [Sandaracinaceae bacterium]